MRSQALTRLLLIVVTTAVVLAAETDGSGASLPPQVKLDARPRINVGVDVYIWIAPGVNVAGFQFEVLFDRNGEAREGDVHDRATTFILLLLKFEPLG